MHFVCLDTTYYNIRGFSCIFHLTSLEFVFPCLSIYQNILSYFVIEILGSARHCKILVYILFYFVFHLKHLEFVLHF